jgi:hypothetical protein
MAAAAASPRPTATPYSSDRPIIPPTALAASDPPLFRLPSPKNKLSNSGYLSFIVKIGKNKCFSLDKKNDTLYNEIHQRSISHKI